LAAQFPESLAGIHLSGTGARLLPEAEQTEKERAWVRASNAFRQTEWIILANNRENHRPSRSLFPTAR
jgi:hypothetical protein